MPDRGQTRPALPVAAGQTSCVLVLCLVMLAPSEMLFNGVGMDRIRFH